MTITRLITSLHLLLISITSFCQSDNMLCQKASDDFIKKVDFSIEHNAVYLSNVKIGKEDNGCKLLLDNGSPYTFISERIARKVSFKEKRKITVTDISGKKGKLSVGRLDYKISGIVFSNIKTVILPNESFENECDVDGIIGLNLIEKCVWSISKNKGIFISSDVSNFPVQEYVEQELYFKNTISCVFEGTEPSLAFFDLGMNTFCKMNSDNINAITNKITINATRCNTNSGTIFSYKEDSIKDMVQISSIAMINEINLLGDSAIKNAIIKVDYSSNSYLTFGSGLLDYYDIILDVIEDKFYSHNIKTDLAQRKLFGLGFQLQDTAIYVNYIVENSPTTRGGILLGDTITELNNISIRKIIKDVRKCELKDAIWDELERKDEAIIKITRLKEPITIKQKFLFP